MKAKKYAVVEWSWEDIQQVRPSWTKKQCISFLEIYEGKISDAMVEEGWNAINCAIEDFEG